MLFIFGHTLILSVGDSVMIAFNITASRGVTFVSLSKDTPKKQHNNHFIIIMITFVVS